MTAERHIGLVERQLERERRARQEAEALLEEKSAALYQAKLNLEAANSGKEQYLQVLTDFALAISQISSVDELAWYVVRKVVGRLGFSDCVFYLYDADRDCILQRAAIADKNPGGEDILNPLAIPLGEGITGTVAKTRMAEIVNDVTTDPRYIPDVMPGGSEICVPMVHNGVLIGVIDCEDSSKDAFNDNHLTTLETVAAYASAKIAERHAHQEAVARTEELEAKVEQLTRLSKELEIAKEEAEESSALKSRFVATISHEIRTPLAGMLGSLDLLGDEDLPAKADALVEMARTSGETLQTLLNDVIDFARSEAGTLQMEPTAFSLQELVASLQSFWQPHMEAHGALLGVDVKAGVAGAYWGDPARIRQVLNNFLSNALKYGGPGTIILTIEQATEPNGEPGLRFSVSDAGPGISEEDQALLFKEFTRVGTHKRQIGEGAGLGLAICSQMAELMGGRVGVESALGEGARFWLALPAKPTEMPETDPGTKRGEHTNFRERLGRRPRVLVAEDVPTNQTLIRLTLERFGCLVTIVNNGIEAVEAARTHSFDIIFMDIAMPEMDGTEATARIRDFLGPEQCPPIYALTAHGTDADREEFETAGMVGIVTKPFDRQDLYVAIENSLALAKETESPKPMVDITAYDELPAFDAEMVDALLGVLDLESRDMLLTQCIKDLEDCLCVLRAGEEAVNAGEVAEAAHRLKSVGGTFGLTRVAQIAGAASEAGKQGADSEALALAPIIADQLASGIETLKALAVKTQEEGALL